MLLLSGDFVCKDNNPWRGSVHDQIIQCGNGNYFGAVQLRTYRKNYARKGVNRSNFAALVISVVRKLRNWTCMWPCELDRGSSVIGITVGRL